MKFCVRIVLYLRSYFLARRVLSSARAWVDGYVYADRMLRNCGHAAYYKLDDESTPVISSATAFDFGIRARLYEYADGGAKESL